MTKQEEHTPLKVVFWVTAAIFSSFLLLPSCSAAPNKKATVDFSNPKNWTGQPVKPKWGLLRNLTQCIEVQPGITQCVFERGAYCLIVVDDGISAIDCVRVDPRSFRFK